MAEGLALRAGENMDYMNEDETNKQVNKAETRAISGTKPYENDLRHQCWE